MIDLANIDWSGTSSVGRSGERCRAVAGGLGDPEAARRAGAHPLSTSARAHGNAAAVCILYDDRNR